MDFDNDYMGSFAQENVSFITQIIKTAVVGDNYKKGMIFVEDDRFVDNSTWQEVTTGVKAITVNADTFAEVTNGLLRSWLYDFFAAGNPYDCILVSCGAKITDAAAETFIANMTAAFNKLKVYAYFKTVCACVDAEEEGEDPVFCTAAAVELAKLCKADDIFSSVALLPFSGDPLDPTQDALYNAIKTANTDAFMSWHVDNTRNAALLSVGFALSYLNGSNTPIGNAIDMSALGFITPSAGDDNPTPAQKNACDTLRIQYFKTVGDNTGSVAAIGEKSLMGDTIVADWIIDYVTYMSKVDIAKLITTPNFFRNAYNYGRIVDVLNKYLPKFGPSGAGRLEGVAITAPSYSPNVFNGKTVIIPNAWVATYVGTIKEVKVTGSLYIGD